MSSITAHCAPGEPFEDAVTGCCRARSTRWTLGQCVAPDECLIMYTRGDHARVTVYRREWRSLWLRRIYAVRCHGCAFREEPPGAAEWERLGVDPVIR
jgi:hypothetical protein